MEPFPVGTRVSLTGLSINYLNGAQGSIVGLPDPISGRYQVIVYHPREAQMKHTDGVKVRPINLTVNVDRQLAVSVSDFDVDPVRLTPEQSASCKALAGWIRVPIPHLLGIPLAMFLLTTGRLTRKNSVAVWNMGDPVTGLAPVELWVNGMRPVLLARMDGKDFSQSQMVRGPGSRKGRVSARKLTNP